VYRRGPAAWSAGRRVRGQHGTASLRICGGGGGGGGSGGGGGRVQLTVILRERRSGSGSGSGSVEQSSAAPRGAVDTGRLDGAWPALRSTFDRAESREREREKASIGAGLKAAPAFWRRRQPSASHLQGFHAESIIRVHSHHFACQCLETRPLGERHRRAS